MTTPTTHSSVKEGEDEGEGNVGMVRVTSLLSYEYLDPKDS